jgi:glycerol-3-phosphate dehydrogenase subunit C
MLGPASERFRLLNEGEDNSLSYCANCKNCDISCPQGVEVSNINMLARAEYCRQNPPSFRDWILAHGEWEAKLVSYFPSFLVNFGMANPASKLILDALGISKKADLPKFAPRQFPEMFKHYVQPDNLNKRVVFFPGCFIKAYAPQTGLDLVWLLNKAGYRVESPDIFCCCGTPLYTNGFEKDARKNTEINLKEIHAWRNAGIPVLSLCPSCELMFKSEIPAFFPDIAEKFSNTALDDATEFILGCIERGELDISHIADSSLDIIYHAPCHLRAQGMGLPGLELLKMLPGIHAVNADAGCCGISGSYGFKKEKYDIAMAVGSKLFETIKESGIRQTATECGTCKVQIIHGTGNPCDHPLSILRRRLDYHDK